MRVWPAPFASQRVVTLEQVCVRRDRPDGHRSADNPRRRPERAGCRAGLPQWRESSAARCASCRPHPTSPVPSGAGASQQGCQKGSARRRRIVGGVAGGRCYAPRAGWTQARPASPGADGHGGRRAGISIAGSGSRGGGRLFVRAGLDTEQRWLTFAWIRDVLRIPAAGVSTSTASLGVVVQALRAAAGDSRGKRWGVIGRRHALALAAVTDQVHDGARLTNTGLVGRDRQGLRRLAADRRATAAA